MAGIKINLSSLSDGDATEAVYATFARLPSTYKISGTSPTVINVALTLFVIFVVLSRKSIEESVRAASVPDDDVGFFVFMLILTAAGSAYFARKGARLLRTKLITISEYEVIIEFPNNPYAQSLRTPKSEYRGITRREGSRPQGRRTVALDIIELLHRDEARTVPLRITEDEVTPEHEVQAIAAQIGVDYLVSSYIKQVPPLRSAVPSENPSEEISEPSMTEIFSAIKKNVSGAAAPPETSTSEDAMHADRMTRPIAPEKSFNPNKTPKTVFLAQGTGLHGPRILIGRTSYWNIPISPYSLRSVSVWLAGCLFVYGQFAPDQILRFFGGVWLVLSLWQLIFGKRGVQSLAVETRHIVLKMDPDTLLRRRFQKGRADIRFEKKEIADIFVRRRANGTRDELVIQTASKTGSANLDLDRSDLQWIRNYLVVQTKLMQRISDDERPREQKSNI